MSQPRWIKAQSEAGPVQQTWWSIIDTQAEFIRATAYGMDLAQSLVDGLNQAEPEPEPDGSISP